MSDALRLGWSVERVAELSAIEPFFLPKVQNIPVLEERLRREPLEPRRRTGGISPPPAPPTSRPTFSPLSRDRRIDGANTRAPASCAPTR
ncbi:MAG: hypothetical protein ACREQY_07980 [Candidatus Binatia bacterium]